MAEVSTLRSFLEGLDRSGLDVPNDMHVRLQLEDDDRAFLASPIHPAAFVFIALAQHNGIPTRLLDWSRVALYAAYFAAAGAAKSPDVPSRLSVWALRSDLVRAAQSHLGIENAPNAPFLEIRTAPRATNTNLHAQAGLFTLWDADKTKPLEQIVQQLLGLLDSAGHPWPIPNPPLVRFDLPTAQAPKLLRLLSNEQIDAARMFPSREGVVMAIKERALWDRP